MTTHLTIVDETRAELAELGIETRVHRVLCSECRFVDRFNYAMPNGRRTILFGCTVNGDKRCRNLNPEGLCDKYEPNAAAQERLRREELRLAKHQASLARLPGPSIALRAYAAASTIVILYFWIFA